MTTSSRSPVARLYGSVAFAALVAIALAAGCFAPRRGNALARARSAVSPGVPDEPLVVTKP